MKKIKNFNKDFRNNLMIDLEFLKDVNYVVY
jgi:hypothetical protein